jgi:hypothetical protein
MVKLGKYEYFVSNKKNKKLFTIINGKEIHFGDSRYDHFKDSTNLLPKSSNHGDEVRRKAYIARASKIQDGAGNLTANDPSSPNWHSLRVLWGFN